MANFYGDHKNEYVEAATIAPSVPIRITHVREEMETLDKTLAELDAITEALQGKLEPILRDEKAIVDETKDISKAEYRVPLANLIREHRWTAVRIIRRINSIMERLEL